MPDQPSFSLSGKVVVQFGGTGLLGRALVDAAAAAGAQLVVASRDKAAIEKMAAGRPIRAEQVDIGEEASIAGLRDRLLKDYGRIDGVVYNAVSRPMRGPDDALANFQASMTTNATGFFAAVRCLGDAMAERKSGSIVNIASHMGMVGMSPHLYDGPKAMPSPDYFFHKGGMLNLTRYLATRYGAANVRVNVVSPGGIYNPEKPQPGPFLEKYAPLTILGRMANAPEIGGAVVFLLSDASTYITGINLPVDGGYTAK